MIGDVKLQKRQGAKQNTEKKLNSVEQKSQDMQENRGLKEIAYGIWGFEYGGETDYDIYRHMLGMQPGM
jgi:hypothetical protein